MKTINVSHATMELIRSAALHRFQETGHRLIDGSWDIPLTEEVYDRLADKRFVGESWDDTILRIITVSRTGVQ